MSALEHTNYDGADTARAARLATALGWVSAGLGAAQLAAPRAVARAAGVDDSPAARAMLPLAGARELAHAAGLIRGRQPSRWIWTRVAGDAMDLTTLGQALSHRTGKRRARVMTATAVVVGITAIDVYTAVLTSRARRSAGRGSGLRVEAAITVRRSPSEVYRYWHNMENLATFMEHLVSVDVLSETRTRWTASAPGGTSVTWEAEITADKPGELIGWRSVPGAAVPNAGSVRFRPAPGGRGTEVRVELAYDPPGGKAAAMIARLFGENPEQQVRDDLRRFKQVMEIGEVVVSEGSPEGTKARRQFFQRPARPVRRERFAVSTRGRSQR